MTNFPFMDHPAMKNIDKNKLDILTEFINNTENKSIEQIIPILMDTNSKMKAQNLSFTKPENDLLIDILTKDMSAGDKMKFELIKKMIKKQS